MATLAGLNWACLLRNQIFWVTAEAFHSVTTRSHLESGHSDKDLSLGFLLSLLRAPSKITTSSWVCEVSDLCPNHLVNNRCLLPCCLSPALSWPGTEDCPFPHSLHAYSGISKHEIQWFYFLCVDALKLCLQSKSSWGGGSDSEAAPCWLCVGGRCLPVVQQVIIYIVFFFFFAINNISF